MERKLYLDAPTVKDIDKRSKLQNLSSICSNFQTPWLNYNLQRFPRKDFSRLRFDSYCISVSDSRETRYDLMVEFTGRACKRTI